MHDVPVALNQILNVIAFFIFLLGIVLLFILTAILIFLPLSGFLLFGVTLKATIREAK